MTGISPVDPTAARSPILSGPLEFPSAACGRNQVEGCGWPRAVSRQLSVFIFFFFKRFQQTSSRNAEKSQSENYPPHELEVVFEKMSPAYRFGQNPEAPVMEDVASPLQVLMDQILLGVFRDIDAVYCGCCLPRESETTPAFHPASTS